MSHTTQQLEALRERAEAANRKVSRLQGEQQAALKQLQELERQCKEEFECPLKELPKVLQNTEAALEQQVARLEEELDALESSLEPGDEPTDD